MFSKKVLIGQCDAVIRCRRRHKNHRIATMNGVMMMKYRMKQC